jgi:hypothetical protein
VVILVDYPGFNLGIAKFLKVQDLYSRLLLYIPEDMGMEGISYQKYQKGCEGDVFYLAI